jgi:diguanylate cyclase (GGDEF)-like protein
MGIRAKLLLPLLMLVTVFAAVLELYIVPRGIETYFQQRSLLQEQQLKLLGITLEEALLKGNLAQVHMTLNVILEQQPEWRTLTLVKQDGRRVYPVGAVSEPDAGPFLIDLSHEIIYLDQVLGTLRLVADLGEIVAQQQSQQRNLFWALILLLLIASGIGAFMQDRLIRRPLNLLASAAGRVARGDYQVHLPETSNDEVGQLIKAFGHMRDQRQHAETELHTQAYTDTLTGLPNRAQFNAYLDKALERHKGSGESLALLFIDLDRFKVINDTLGHEIGDRLLIEAGRRISKCVRGNDLVARLGGDEFTIVINDARPGNSIAVVGNRVLEALEQPFIYGSQEVFISPSIGIALCPKNGQDRDRLMKHADTAMYRAKEEGGNCYRYYEPEMGTTMSHRMRLESGLRRALERDQLVLHYQPQISLADGAMCGAEALLRWNDPDQGLIPPNEFIPLAEDTGLIVPIGEWVLRSACTRYQQWRAAGAGEFMLSINLSVKNLYDPQFPTLVREILDDTGMQPSLLQLEITENAIMQNAEQTILILKQLRDLGVHLAIDDFGTGYSSLSYLKRFPIDTLKVDRTFVQGIPANPDDTAITYATITMAHSLKCKVVAEGVETSEQRDLLQSWSCEMAQGYLYSKPLPAAEFLAFAKSRKPRACDQTTDSYCANGVLQGIR